MIAVGMIAAALVIVNIIFGYVVAENDTSVKKRSIYSLYRLGVALVEYANSHNTTLTPSSLKVLADDGIVDTCWLRSSEFGPQFGYFGQFDLQGPKPPIVLWDKSEHSAEIAGLTVGVTYALDDRLKVVPYSSKLFEEISEELNSIRSILACGNSQEDIHSLLEHATADSESSARPFAIWKLGRMRLNNLESTFVELLREGDAGFRYEAAEALALLGNPAGGATLLAGLRKPDYFERLRSFKALEELTGNNFGFNPALEAQSQPEAMAGFDAWWADTAKSMRDVQENGRDKNDSRSDE
jgi:hypothetical protein